MNKINVLVLLFSFLVVQTCAYAQRTLTTYNQVPNNYYYDNNNAYSNDLMDVEEYLFGRNFKKDSLNFRLNRIEKRLFNHCYPSMSPVDRINNILLSYQDKYYNNYLSNNRDDTIAQKLLNRFIGQPTGFTPPVMNTPYNEFGYPVGISRFNSGNRGYRYNNTVPGSMGAGIHILD